jgi:hypothetical protein
MYYITLYKLQVSSTSYGGDVAGWLNSSHPSSFVVPRCGCRSHTLAVVTWLDGVVTVGCQLVVPKK